MSAIPFTPYVTSFVDMVIHLRHNSPSYYTRLRNTVTRCSIAQWFKKMIASEARFKASSRRSPDAYHPLSLLSDTCLPQQEVIIIIYYLYFEFKYLSSSKPPCTLLIMRLNDDRTIPHLRSSRSFQTPAVAARASFNQAPYHQ